MNLVAQFMKFLVLSVQSTNPIFLAKIGTGKFTFSHFALRSFRPIRAQNKMAGEGVQSRPPPLLSPSFLEDCLPKHATSVSLWTRPLNPLPACGEFVGDITCSIMGILKNINIHVVRRKRFRCLVLCLIVFFYSFT